MFYSLAFLAGVVCLQGCGRLPDPGWAGLLVPLALVCGWQRHLRWAAVVAVGFLWAWWQASLALAGRLPVDWAGNDRLVRGRIDALPEHLDGGGARVRFRVADYYDSSSGGWRPLDLSVRLRWYRSAPRLHAGERWQLQVRLKRPHGFANPGGFDYERWLLVQRIGATGYVREGPDNRRLEASHGSGIDVGRQALARAIDASVDGAAAGLLRALAIGDRSGVSRRQWEVLRITGTAHLMAISGLHIGLVAGLAFAGMRRLWGLGGLAGRWPGASAAALAALGAAALYAGLAGFSLPTRRALVMVSAFMGARLLRRRISAWQALALALWLVLLLDSLALLSPGFWLSFGAVGWILYQLSGRYGKTGRLRVALRVQLVLSLGLAPLVLASFQFWPAAGPLANLLAVPWVGLLVVPPLLAGCLLAPLAPSLSAWLFQAAGATLAPLWQGLEWLASMPGAAWTLGLPHTAAVVLLSVGLIGWLAPAGMPARWSALALVAPLFLYRPEAPAQGAVWLTLLDVGQGLAAVVRTRHHVLVYDTGPRFRSGLDTGSAVVAPYLVHAGIRRIDKLVISHSDNDHAGGGGALFARHRVMSVLAGMPEAIDWARARRCRRGQRWSWDGVEFALLSPAAPVRGNNASCVLRVTSGAGQRLLLTGDIESSVEKRLADADGEGLRAEVLVAPHHGSATSSSAAFVARVKPDYVLYPAAERNRFGFPRPSVVTRYRQVGARQFSTGVGGALSARFSAAGGIIEVSAFRQTEARYWR